MRWWHLMLLVLAVALPGADAWVERVLVPSLDVELEGIDTWRPPTVVRLATRDGRIVDDFALVRRVWIDLDEVPDVAWQAVVAAEDRRFFDHHGVDFLGIARAVVVNVAAGRIEEGGSTLTQQLVKNVVVGNARSFERKAREALLAWRLEQRLDKRTILELYLNLIYLGSGNYGIEAASQDFFGVSAREIDAGQAALLAGLIPAPSAYSPRRDPELAAARRRLVLNAMVDMGVLDVTDGQWFKKRPVDPPVRRDGTKGPGMAYLTAARREVRRLLGEEVPFQAGLTVYTPFDPAVQDVAEAAVRAAVEGVEARQGIPGASRQVTGDELRRFLVEAPGRARDAEGALIEPKAGDCFEAAYVGNGKVASGLSQWRFGARSWSRRIWQPDFEVPAMPLSETARWGDVFQVCLGTDGRVELPDQTWAEGAAVVVETATGAIVAMVGGRDMTLEGFNRATQARRQAGSSFKPYVYASAFEHGWTQLDPVLDAPLWLDAGHGQVWSPKNSGGRYLGKTVVRTAFAYSLNTVAVRLAMDAGIKRVVDVATGAGVRSRLRKDLTLALGTSEVTVLDQAMGISMFPRLGKAVEPVFVERLVDVRDREVGRAGERVRLDGVDVVLPGGTSRKVVAPSTAYQVVDLMRGTIQEGTGRSARTSGRDLGGKTGTTSGFNDAWFVGFTPTWTVAVWIGRDDRQTLGFNESGARAALPAWKRIVDALPEAAGARIHPPPDVVLMPWADGWVGLEARRMSQARLPWTEPTQAPLPIFPGVRPAVCATSQDTIGAR